MAVGDSAKKIRKVLKAQGHAAKTKKVWSLSRLRSFPYSHIAGTSTKAAMDRASPRFSVPPPRLCMICSMKLSMRTCARERQMIPASSNGKPAGYLFLFLLPFREGLSNGCPGRPGGLSKKSRHADRDTAVR